MHYAFSSSRSGFTLVELSIVLVILGLLVGGVLAGQSLIRAAELRSISTQFTNYTMAVNTFRDKYFALPGDMNNAQSFWGVAHATPATCVTTASTTALTCNGDGNGVISDGAAGSNEVFRFWQHLANAGMVEGSFSGITQGSTTTSATRANSPAGKASGTIWLTYNWGTMSGDSGLFNGIYNHILTIGGVVANSSPVGPHIKPDEMWNIDTKMDDGRPATGRMVTRGTFANCTDTTLNTAMTANYLLNSTNTGCVPVFRNLY